jgi:hypothetical protein
MDLLLVEQHTVFDGQATPPVKEGAKYTQSLGDLLVIVSLWLEFIGARRMARNGIWFRNREQELHLSLLTWNLSTR